MKSLIAIIAYLPLLLPVCSTAQGIRFQEISLKEAFTQASNENKNIFIDVYTTWCGPCRWMDLNVFSLDEVGDFMNTKFISVKADAEGSGHSIARKYNVRAYPTFIFLDSEGNVIRTERGGRPADAFLMMARNHMMQSEEIRAMHERYKKGDRSSEFLISYLHHLKEDHDPRFQEILKKYLKGQDEWLTKMNMNIIIQYTLDDITSKGYEFLLNNKQDFYAQFGNEVIDQKIRLALINEWEKKEDEIVETKIKKHYLEAFPTSGSQLFEEDRLYYLLRSPFTSNPGILSKAAKQCFNEGDCKDWFLLNEVAFRLALRTDHHSSLQMLQEWVEQSIALQKTSKNMDTYSVILYKLGEDDRAIEAVKEAHQLALTEGIKFKSTIRILRDLEKN